MEYTYTQLVILATVSGLAAAFFGTMILVKGFKKSYDNIKINDEKGNMSAKSMIGSAFIRMLPFIFLFVLACIPMFYFMAQIKKWNYCISLITFDPKKIVPKDDDDIIERCDCLDKDALYEDALNQIGK